MQKEIKSKGDNMANPYGNNGFNRIQGQPQTNGQQRQFRQPAQNAFGQPQQAGYVDPRFANQMQQTGYVDPRFGNQMQQPMYGQPQQAGYVDPRFGNQMQMTPQQIQQMQMQQMQMQQMQRQQMPGAGLNPMQNMPQPQFGQPQQGTFGQPQQPTAGRAISSIVDDIPSTVNTQVPVNAQPASNQKVNEEINENAFGPADGSEFPPYYNKNTEKLIKIYNRDTMTYSWKIKKQ